MEATPTASRRASRLRRALFIFFGIILPLTAIALKEMAADIFFDPAPTALHWALLLLVPFFHVAMLLIPPAAFQKSGLAVVAGICLGVSTAYTIAFSPILPIAAVFTLVGIGFLPFAPLGALISSAFALRRIAREVALTQPSDGIRFDRRTHVRAIAGVISGLTLLVTPSVQDWVALRGMRQAASPHAEEAADAIASLRTWGSHRAMLEAGMNRARNQGFFDLESILGDRVPHNEAAAIYYKVTGETVAQGALRYGSQDDDEERWWNDPWLGGTQVGEMDPDVSLIGSRLDGSIDGDAALGYSEWTLEFKNSHAFQSKEARARITLPHGGVVSRVTLWVNGQPQEAAFGGSSQVRAAYEAVVRARRDPLLVTQTGPDEVGIQCFPILPTGGTMKIRLGITYPLDVVRPDQARVTLPAILARNFELPDSTTHSVWLESSENLKTARFGSSKGHEGQQVLSFDEAEVLEEGSPISIEVARRPSPLAWTPDRLGEVKTETEVEPTPHQESAESAAPSPGIEPKKTEEVRIEQRFEPISKVPPSRIALVVDTSAPMEATIHTVADTLEARGAQHLGELRVALPHDRGFDWISTSKERALSEIAAKLRAVNPVGGVDNLPAVIAAMRWAASSKNSLVLWIHGPQPVTLSDPAGIEQALERSSATLIHAQISPGEHAALTRLGTHPRLLAFPRYGQFSSDLNEFLEELSGTPRLRPIRTRVVITGEEEELQMLKGSRTSDHLARLWAADEIDALTPAHRDTAVELATRYRLVTPVSGAVVLETAAQYEEAGLDPGGSPSLGSPSVPEPETWAMLLLCAGILLWQMKKRESRSHA